jgi:hypothetical protein
MNTLHQLMQLLHEPMQALAPTDAAFTSTHAGFTSTDVENLPEQQIHAYGGLHQVMSHTIAYTVA